MKLFWQLLWLLVFVGAAVALVRALRQTRRSSHGNTAAPPQPQQPPQVPQASAVRQIADNPANSANDDMPADKDMPDEPPPPPDVPPLVLSERSLEEVRGTEQARQLWLAVQREIYRQRAEGFREDWAFPLHASRHNLGAPLAKSARVKESNAEYAFQPFARGTIFNEVPKWSEVHELNKQLGGSIPGGGLALNLLAATFEAAGSALQADWAFHQLAIKEALGPALRDTVRIKVGGKEYSVQVFAADTLYSEVPNWSDVQRLSDTPAGELADALWRETYAVSRASYDASAPTQQAAAREKLGTPLTGPYQLDFEGHTFTVQVFATDAVLADEQGEVLLHSTLERPDTFKPEAAPPPPEAITPGDVSSAGDAISDKRPLFAMLPVAGQPRISQLYGYTKWAAGGGRKYYTACQGRHPGIDFAVPVGTPLLSIGYGLVVYAGPSRGAPFGGSPPMIAIVRYGNLYAIYGHSSQVSVKAGQLVSPGEQVTLSGDYGGPHLHFEVRPVPQQVLANTDPGQPGVNSGFTINPLDYFNAEMNAYFERWYHELGGDNHFCRGSLRDQEKITFAGPVDTRPCTS
jgi:murein DD-endopeptidase MepM/ murein hydrolase activator NlpD